MEPLQHTEENAVVSTPSFIHHYAIPIAGLMIAVSHYLIETQKSYAASVDGAVARTAQLQENVTPSEGVALPVVWGDIGKELVDAGVINPVKIAALYKDQGGFPSAYQKMLEPNADGKIIITRENAGYLLDLFWALGLANKDPILEDKTGMMDPTYGGAANFASTAGWTIGKGDAMDHYDMHMLVPLTADQQKLVDEVSSTIYRPCCGNSTHFPDCNHGMAMLGLLELMAAQGVSEQDMYKAVLVVNSYWFPDTYLTIATYMQSKGVAWKDVSPQEMLSADYSSGAGFQKISSQASAPSGNGGGGGCSVAS